MMNDREALVVRWIELTLLVAALTALVCFALCANAQTPTPTSTPTATPTVTPTVTPTGSPTRTPTAPVSSRLSLARQVRPGFGTMATEPTTNKLGDTFYATDWRSFGSVAGNTTATTKYYCQTGTGTISAAPGWCSAAGGTVTSVGSGTIGSLFSVSWATATTTPALSLNLAAQAANCVIAGPTSGGSAVPTCRALVVADVPVSAATNALNSATTVVNVSSATAPSAGQTLTATSSTSATWQTSSAGAASDLLSATTTVNVSAAAAPTSGQLLTATSGTTATWQTASGGSSAGTRFVMADPNFSVGSNYERANYWQAGYGLVQLAPQRSWIEVIADAKTNPPGGWTWANSTVLNNADENTTTANALRIQSTAAANQWYGSGGTTSPLAYKTYAPSAAMQEWILRVSIPTASQGAARYGAVIVCDDGNTPTTARILFGYSGSAYLLLYSMNTTDYTLVNPTSQQINDGIWLRLRKTGAVLTVHYNLTNQATPPVFSLQLDSQSGLTTALQRVGVTPMNYAGTAGTLVDWLYFDDRDGGPFPTDASATGFDDTSPVLTLVSGFDLGASTATVANADVQAALGEIVNPRVIDTAAWTHSVSRGSSPPVSCGGGSYASAATATVGGTGRYISVCSKAASTGRMLPAALNATGLRIPFAP